MRTILLGLCVLVACGGSDRPGTDDPIDAAIDGSVTQRCGATLDGACGADEYCDFAADTCGLADEIGTCKPRPSACPAIVDEVCGCDGKVHTSPCATYVDGFDLNAHGCPGVPGKFACGYELCDLQTEYCRREPRADAPVTYTCVALPSACQPTPSCACLAAERCGGACAGEAKVGLTLTCPSR